MKAFSYYGGKLSKLSFIIPQLKTEHKTFVEVCGGSAAVLLNKPRAKLEVLNDLAKEVATFWRVMRERPDELIRQIDCTPGGELEYKRARTLPPTDDEVEIARRFFVRVSQSFSCAPRSANYSFERARRFNTDRRDLDAVANRMQGVIVENTTAVKIINRLIASQNKAEGYKPILFYVDPPYTIDSRKTSGEYICDDFNHEELLSVMNNAPSWCKFAVSGYGNKLYDDALADWYRVESEFALAANTNESGKRRTEVIWRNYEVETAQTSLDL